VEVNASLSQPLGPAADLKEETGAGPPARTDDVQRERASCIPDLQARRGILTALSLDRSPTATPAPCCGHGRLKRPV
jgi:hypothetical protein